MPSTSFLNGRKCYYLLSRSKDERALFSGLADYREYVRLLKRCKKKFGISVFAFCLMPDYAGLIIHAPGSGQVSAFIQELNRQYRSHLNKRYGHGDLPLWRRPCRFLLDTDQDLLAGIQYLEAAPVRSGLVDSPLRYPWSSYAYRILGMRSQILDVTFSQINEETSKKE